MGGIIGDDGIEGIQLGVTYRKSFSIFTDMG